MIQELTKIISPEGFEDLADWLDMVDETLQLSGSEVQQDLRKFAEALRFYAKEEQS